jgi:ABC-type microcin C transport system permease subunit YejB
LTDIIIPFFERFPLQGLKSKNFSDFTKAAKIIKVKEHLTQEGLDKLIQIKAGMNSRRI